jgi:shikimate kinase
MMNKHGITVFLDVEIEWILYNKLASKGTHKRPLLKGKSKKNSGKNLFQNTRIENPFITNRKSAWSNVSDDVNETGLIR